MKTNKIKVLIFIISIVFVFASCKDGDKFKGMILVDPNTGDKYLLKHNVGDTYFIDKLEKLIIGNDTTYVFR